MPEKLDLTGQKFNRLTVISEAENKGKHSRWNCICDCGTLTIVTTSNLRQNRTKSCGCIRPELPNKGRYKEIRNTYIDMGEYIIGLTQANEEFEIDKEDYDKVKEYCWHITQKGYVKTSLGGSGSKKLFLHRLIMNPKEREQVDHINRVKTDNRKSNLRTCSNKENTKNNNAKGYYYKEKSKRWRASITVNGERKYLGSFDKESLAIEARRSAELKYFKEFAPIR